MTKIPISIYEITRTLWPIFVFIIFFLLWALESRTVSQNDFNLLQIRTIVLEEQMTGKDAMLKLHESIAGIRVQIDHLTSSMDRIENKIK